MEISAFSMHEVPIFFWFLGSYSIKLYSDFPWELSSITPKTPQDNKINFYLFIFTLLRVILQILIMPIALRCCYGNFLFPMCHIILGWKNEETLIVFKRMALSCSNLVEGVFLNSKVKFLKKYLCIKSF